MAFQFPGPQTTGELTVACIDASATRDSLGAYAAEYGLPQWKHLRKRSFSPAQARGGLVSYLSARLAVGPVALGVEAPLWGLRAVQINPAAPRVFEPYLPRPFEVGWPSPNPNAGTPPYPATVTTSWYANAGGAMALVGSRELARLVEMLRPRQLTYGTAGPSMEWQPGELLVWEAFVPTALKAVTMGCTHGSGSGHVRDAAHAVECGFVAVGSGCPTSGGQRSISTAAATGAHANEVPEVVPLLGDALCHATEITASQAPAWWTEPCMVIGPRCNGNIALPSWLHWAPSQLLHW